MDFEFRKLKSSDLFPMMKIMGKVGINEFKDKISPEALGQMISGGKDKNGVDTANIVGFSILLDVVDVLANNLPKCEKDIYSFLASVSNLSVKEIAELPPADFAKMIIALFQNEDFRDFFTVVLDAFKGTNQKQITA